MEEVSIMLFESGDIDKVDNMTIEVGDIICYKPNNLLTMHYLILQNLTPDSNFGTKYAVINLGTGGQGNLVLFPIDNMYITKVA